MKTKKLNGLKILGATLAASSAGIAAATLASCAQTTNRFSAIGGDLDREYNVSQATFKALQGQFTLKLENHLKDVPPDKRMREMKALAKSLSSINQNYASNKKYSYSLLSSMLVEKARRQYGIKLVTESSAQWSDAKKMFIGMQNSLRSYMKSQRIDRTIIEVIMEESNTKFTTMMEGSEEQNIVGIRQKYDDPLTGIIHAKANILNCFDEINTDIALVCATNRLKQFMDDYSITIKGGVKLDQLESKYPAIANEKNYDLTKDKAADDIFRIVHNDTNTEITKFSELVIPGYKITPILTNVSRDAVKNEYSLNVDWTCAKDTYSNKNINESKAVAHLFRNDKLANVLFDDEFKNESLFDILTESNETNPIPYPVRLSADAEKQALQDTYVSKLNFAWQKEDFAANKNSYEAFFQGNNISLPTADKPIYRINASSLAQSGLTISVKGEQNTDWTNPIRFDQLLNTPHIIGESKAEDIELSNDENGKLIQNFLAYCDIESLAQVDKSSSSENAAHTVTNKLIISYKNTLSKNDESSCQLAEQKNSGFTIGKQSYTYLTLRYNQLCDNMKPYNNEQGEVAEALDQVEFEWDLTLVLFTLGALVSAEILGALFYLSFIKGGWAIVALIFTLLSWALQIYDIVLLKDKRDKLNEYADSLFKFIHSPEVDAYNAMLAKDSEDFYLIRAEQDPKYNQLGNVQVFDSDKFTTAYGNFQRVTNKEDWEKVKEILNRYQNIASNDTYVNFIAAAKKSDVPPNKFRELAKHWTWTYSLISLGLNVGSIACDLAAAGLMKLFDRTGKTTADLAEKTEITQTKTEAVGKDIVEVKHEPLPSESGAVKDLPVENSTQASGQAFTKDEEAILEKKIDILRKIPTPEDKALGRTLDPFYYAEVQMKDNPPLLGFNYDEQLSKIKDIDKLSLPEGQKVEDIWTPEDMKCSFIGEKILNDEKFRNDMIAAFPTTQYPNMREGFAVLGNRPNLVYQPWETSGTTHILAADWMGEVQRSINTTMSHIGGYYAAKSLKEANEFNILRVFRDRMNFSLYKYSDVPKETSGVLEEILFNFRNTEKMAEGDEVVLDVMEKTKYGFLDPQFSEKNKLVNRGYYWFLGKIFINGINEDKKLLPPMIALVKAA